MSQWFYVHSGKINQIVKDLEEAKMMGSEFGNVDLTEVIDFLIKSSRELLNLENEKNELLKENKKLKNNLKALDRTAEKGNGEN